VVTSRARFRAVWLGALALGYAAFLFWYGGSGRPVTAAEGRAYLERLRATQEVTEHPDLLPAIEDLIAHDDGREFFMANLISMKPGPEAAAYDAAYSRAVAPALLRHGCFPIYLGQVRRVLLGDDGTGTNRVAIVRYRSLRDFLDIFADPAMSEGTKHKFASLSHTEVIATTPLVSLLTVRTTVALVVLLVGCTPWIRTGRDRRGAAKNGA